MTGKVLITGMLFARPEKRTLRNGSQCVLAIVKSRESNHTRLWHIAASLQCQTRRSSIFKSRPKQTLFD
jgi:hypothetical protein